MSFTNFAIWFYIGWLVAIIGVYGWLDHRNLMRDADESLRDL